MKYLKIALLFALGLLPQTSRAYESIGGAPTDGPATILLGNTVPATPIAAGVSAATAPKANALVLMDVNGDIGVHSLTLTGTLTESGASSVATQTVTGLAVGGVVFSSTPSNGRLAVDISNLFWDDINNRLGIGTGSPGTSLHVSSGVTTLDGTGTQLVVSSGPVGDYAAKFTGTTTSGQSYGILVRAGTSSADQAAYVRLANGNAGFVVRGDGNVGVGTNAPASTLHVSGDETITGQATFVSSMTNTNGQIQIGPAAPATNSSAYIYMQKSNTQANWKISTNDSLAGGIEVSSSSTAGGVAWNTTPAFAIQANGNTRIVGPVSIGTTTFTSTVGLNVLGQLRQSDTVSCATGIQVTATGVLSGCVASDQKLKRDISTIKYHGGIDALRPVSYRWKDIANRDDREHIGFIAQEVQKVFPGAVVSAGAGLLGIDSNAMISEVVLDLQNSHKEVAALKALVLKLDARLKILEAKP